MKLYKLDGFPLSDRNSTYGGNSGDKEGILIDNEYWIVKYPKKGSRLKDVKDMSYASTPESEYIGSHVYEILGYPVHKTILGIRNGHLVVGCKDLCSENQRLIEFRQLKNTYNKTLNEKLNTSISSTGSEHFTVLEEILIHLKYNPSLLKIKGINERFWDCAVIDGFINNNDRNNGNWGIIRTGNNDELAPIFDNGASFSPNVSESKIQAKLLNNDVLVQSACSGITAYSLDGEHSALYRDIIKLDNKELKAAIKRNVPLIKSKMSEIERLIDEIPENVGRYYIISKARKTIYKKELHIRLENILVPEYTKIISDERKREKDEDYDYSR